MPMKKNRRFFLLFAGLSLVYFLFDWSRGLLLTWEDGIQEIYPLKVLASEIIRQGGLPLWNPYMFIGFPLLGSMQPSVFYPLGAFFLFLPPPLALNLSTLLHSTLAGFFTFLYARLLCGRDFPAIMAGMAFGFLGYVQCHLNHVPIYYAAVWLPLILYFIEKLRVEGRMLYGLSASLAIALQVYAGHPQTLVQSHMLLSFYVLAHAVIAGRSAGLGFAARSAASAALGLLLALPQLVSTYELSTLAFRKTLSYEFFSQFSFPPHLLPSLLFPFLWGKGGEYWGPDHVMRLAEGFAGTLPLLMAVVVVIKRWRADVHVKVWGMIFVIAFVLSLGDYLPFLHKLLYHVPVVNSFRAPVRHFFEVDLAVAVLFGLGLVRVMGRDRPFIKASLTAIGGIAVLAVLASLLVAALKGHIDLRALDLVRPELLFVKTSLASPSIFVPLLILGAYAAALFLFLRLKKASGALLAALLAALLFGEALYFKGKTGPLPKISDIARRQSDGALDFLSKQPGRTAFVFISHGRRTQDLLPITRKVSMLNGYDPLILNDFGDLLDMEGMGFSHTWDDLIKYNSILSVLNTEYLVVPDEKAPTVEAVKGRVERDEKGRMFFVPPIGPDLPPRESYRPVYERLFRSGRGTVYLNKNAMPRAYSVAGLVEAGGLMEVKRKLFTFRVDPRRQAMVPAGDLKAIGRRDFTPGKVRIVDYRPASVRISARFDGEGFLVLADQYYPGWKAYIDGEEARIHRTNGVLRGLVVPGGEHEVVFRYAPYHLYAAMAASLAATLLVLAAIFVPRRTDGGI